MSTSVSSVVSHFPSAEDGFTTTTSSSTASGATTVGLNTVAGYTNGETVVLVIEPTDSNAKQVFTGVVDTSGVQITSVVWTAGTDQTHALGSTVVDYETATHWRMMTKGILVEHVQDGTHKPTLITSRTEDTSPDPDTDYLLTYDDSATTLKKVRLDKLGGAGTGWTPNVLPAPNTVTNNGNRSYDLVFNGTDLTGTVSEGMRIRTTRTVSAPTQCASLASASSQYFSRASASLTGITFTTAFTAMAWVKLESYNGFDNDIIGRFSSTGLILQIYTSGQVRVYAGGTGGNDDQETYQSIPLGRWVHVAASMDVSTNSYAIYIDGVSVPVKSTSTTCTAIIQSGDLTVGGRSGGTNTFDGEIDQVGLFDAVLTQTTIRDIMTHGLSGSETNNVGAWSLGGVITDLNANGNDLTANGGALATTSDSPFGNYLGGTLDYGIVTASSFSTDTTLTVQVPEGCTIPTTGGVGAVAYSTNSSPYGFVRDKSRWEVITKDVTYEIINTPTSGTWYNVGGLSILIPVGQWIVSYQGVLASLKNGTSTYVKGTLSSGSSTESDNDLTTFGGADGAAATSNGSYTAVFVEKGLSLGSAATWYLNVTTITAGHTSVAFRGDLGSTIIKLKPAYL